MSKLEFGLFCIFSLEKTSGWRVRATKHSREKKSRAVWLNFFPVKDTINYTRLIVLTSANTFFDKILGISPI